ncbi:hypothetical protein GCM10009861_00140 [Neomicrococcus aestuarii]
MNFAVSDLPAAISRLTSEGFAKQSVVEKTRSLPEVTVNSCWLVPTFKTHGTVPAFVTVKVRTGFSPEA